MESKANISTIADKVIKELKIAGYSDCYIATHWYLYDSLKKFCKENSISDYTEDIGKQFLADDFQHNPQRSRKRVITFQRIINRLDCMVSGTEWKPIRKSDVEYVKSCYDDVVVAYESYLQSLGKNKHDTRGETHCVARFLK